MAMLGWVMMGLAIYAIKYSSFRVPGEKTTDVAVVLYAVPGALIGIAIVYLIGMRREAQTA